MGFGEAFQKQWSSRTRRDRWVVSSLGLFWVSLIIVIQALFPSNFIRLTELWTQNIRFQVRGPQPPAPQVVVLGIDDNSFVADVFSKEQLVQNPELKLLSSWPWPRRAHALLLEKVLAAGARMVAFDLLFTSPSKYGPEDDAAWRAALEKARGKVIIGANKAEAEVRGGTRTKWMMPTDSVLPDTVPLLELTAAVNYESDVDGVVRRVHPQWESTETNQFITSFPLKAALALDPKTAWAFREREILINYPGPERVEKDNLIPTEPYYMVFYKTGWEQNLRKGEFFRDKIVLVGPTQNFLHDSHPSPFQPAMPGVLIHAAAIGTLLRHNELHDLPSFVEPLLVLLFALGSVLALLAIRHPLLKLAPLVVLVTAYVALVQFAFGKLLLILPLAAPVMVLLPTFITGIAWQLLTEQLEKRRARQALERQVSKEVADELMKEFGALQQMLAPQERHLVVFFSDIRNFTTLFEKGDPKTLITQLNEYLTAMSAIVARHGGTLDKYIGDAIMAFWGAPTSRGPADDALRAVSAALEMRQELAALQPQWKAKGYPEIKIGVGIHAGTALVGEVGSAQRSEYTAIGDTVNTASRIEGINKETGTDLLISEAVYCLVKERVKAHPVGEYALKGRAGRVALYRVDGLLPEKELRPMPA